MDALKTPLALFLGLLATGVLLHFVFTPFYEDLVDTGRMWDIINWFMAVGVILTFGITCARRKNARSEDQSSNAFICANVAFYAATVLAVLFFWNWFDSLTAGEEGQSQTRHNYWAAIDTLFVVLLGSVSAHLCKDASRSKARM